MAAKVEAPAVPAPKLVAVEAVKDVGKVAKGERVKVDFELRNDGPAELLINNVHPTCGCTVASFDAKIAPGATGKIHAEIDTVDFSGPIAKTITVLSNDPLNPRLTLTIKARVEPQINSFPGYARFVYVQNQPTVSLKQWLWTDNFPDFKVLAVTSPYKFIHTTFRAATGDELRAEASIPISGSSNPRFSPTPRSERCATSWWSRPITPSRKSSDWRSPASSGRSFP